MMREFFPIGGDDADIVVSADSWEVFEDNEEGREREESSYHNSPEYRVSKWMGSQ